MELAIRIASAVIGFLGIVLAIVQSVRVYKAKKKAGKDVNLLDIILSNLIPSMEMAETSGMTGTAKKMYVKSCVLLACQSLGISYSDELFESVLERLVDFSKIVNAIPVNTEETTVKKSDNTGYAQGM